MLDFYNDVVFEVNQEDIQIFLSSLQPVSEQVKLDTILDIIINCEGENCFDVIFGQFGNDDLQVLFKLEVSSVSFKLYEHRNDDNFLDVSYSWRKFLLKKYGKKYAEYFAYNWQDIGEEYLETVNLMENYLQEAKKQYEDAIKSYEEVLCELENNKTR